jgi:hypothetical protein
LGNQRKSSFLRISKLFDPLALFNGAAGEHVDFLKFHFWKDLEILHSRCQYFSQVLETAVFQVFCKWVLAPKAEGGLALTASVQHGGEKFPETSVVRSSKHHRNSLLQSRRGRRQSQAFAIKFQFKFW